MRFATGLYRSGALASLTFALLAGASSLAAQTAENPTLVVLNNLQFAHQAGGTAPPAQTVRVYSSPVNVPFTATAQTTTGGGWLFVNGNLQATGTSFGPTSAGQPDLAISVSPNLPAGTYSGTVTVVSGTSSLPIAVTYTVGTTPVIRTDPASLVHTSVEMGRTTTLPLQITSSNATVPVQYSAAVLSATPATGWLAIAPNVGTSGQSAQIVINAALLPEGQTFAVGTLRFTPLTGGGSVTLPITVNVTPGAQLVVNPATVLFPFQVGFNPPATRQVTITSSTQTPLLWNASITTSAPWLTIAASPAVTGSTIASGSTPGSLYLIPNIAAVPSTPQTHEAKVRIEAPATGSVQELTVRLVISNQPQLFVQPESANFNYTLGGIQPTPQTLSVSSTSFQQQFTITPTYTSGGQWFSVSPLTIGSTPTSLVVTVDPTRLSQLGAGSYAGNIRLQSATSTLDVPVNLTVSGSTLITVEPATVPPFEAGQGQTPPARSIIIRSTDSTNQPFNTTVEYGTGAAGWLIVAPQSGSTGTVGSVVTLNVNPNAVTSPGTYTATLVITPTGVTSAPAFRVPVTYVVSGTAAVTADPTRLEVTQSGSTPPAARTIRLNSTTPGLTWSASATTQAGGNWLRLVQSTGTVPGDVLVAFESASLAPGDYTGQITVSVSGVTTLTIPVALRVSSAATLQFTPATLNFTFAQGGATPATQTVNLTSTGAALGYTATATSTGNWLRIDQATASGTTAAAGGAATPVRVTVDPTGLPAGTYQGTISLNSSNASNGTNTINVTLTVTAQSAPTGLVITNAATGVSRGVAPGMFISIFGRNMAPSTAMTTRVVNGIVQGQLGEVRVLFDGIEAPLVYVGPSGDAQGDQINAIVPYSISGRATTRMVVEYRGVRSEPLELVVREADPGIFRSASGQGAILNQDNAVNGPTNPAARGTVIQVYATGEGLTVPAQQSGQVIGTSVPRPLLPVSARVNGQPASVEYAGGVPGFAAGFLQVNVRIPENLSISAPAQVPIDIMVGTVMSQTGVTVAVRP